MMIESQVKGFLGDVLSGRISFDLCRPTIAPPQREGVVLYGWQYKIGYLPEIADWYPKLASEPIGLAGLDLSATPFFAWTSRHESGCALLDGILSGDTPCLPSKPQLGHKLTTFEPRSPMFLFETRDAALIHLRLKMLEEFLGVFGRSFVRG